MAQSFFPGYEPPPVQPHHKTWICLRCDRRMPFTGFDMKRRICGECQAKDRPIEPLVEALRLNYCKVPRRVLIALRESLGMM